MRILLYLDPSPVRGGIEVYADRQAGRLRAAGHEVAVISCIDPDAFARADAVYVHKCASVDDLAAFPPDKTTVYIHDHEPVCPRTYAYTPLGHTCTRPGALWPCLFCAPACRDWRGALRRVLSQRRRKELLARVARIVVISAFMKSRLVANGLPAEKIVVSPPDPAEFPRPAGTVPGPVDLLYAGQLLRGKGVQVLLRAMALMRRPRMLDVIGTGNMEAELRALADRLGVAGRVRWRGFSADVPAWMAAAACVVVPSVWQEPYGLVAAEAVALGRPVVASDIGGLPEACGGKAVLVPPGNAAALADALDAAPPVSDSNRLQSIAVDCNRIPRSPA